MAVETSLAHITTVITQNFVKFTSAKSGATSKIKIG